MDSNEKELDPLALSNLEKPVEEDDGTDFLTLYNLVQGKDAANQAFDWVSLAPMNPRKSVEDVFNTANEKLFVDASFDQDNKPDVSEAVTKQPIEVNAVDPNVFSSHPEINICSAYFGEGSCRITSRPCAYITADHKECALWPLASTSDPQLWDVPPNHENDLSYIKGIRS